MAAVLNTQPVPIRRRSGSYAIGGSTLSVTTPQTNATTGELVLPDLAAGYASATLVLASGRTLSSLPPPALDALFSWVLAGGALALVVDRPEDVHSAWLEALAGGHVQSCAAARKLSQVAQFAVPVDSAGKGVVRRRAARHARIRQALRGAGRDLLRADRRQPARQPLGRKRQLRPRGSALPGLQSEHRARCERPLAAARADRSGAPRLGARQRRGLAAWPGLARRRRASRTCAACSIRTRARAGPWSSPRCCC